MSASIKRGGMAFLALLTALLMTLSMASAASAHEADTEPGDAAGDDVGCGAGDPYQAGDPIVPHDDQFGVPCTDPDHSPTHPGTGTVDSVDNDTPSDAVNVIRDYGLENAPIIIGVIGAIFLVGLTFYLVRRGLMKARGAMRL